MKRTLLALLSALLLVVWPAQLLAQTQTLRYPAAPRFVSTSGWISSHWFGALPTPFISAEGTISSTWQIGGTLGSLWNLNGSALEAKNATNSAFVIARGATPVAANDLATKNYVDTDTVAGDVTGTLNATIVSAISGTTPINVSPNEFKWIQGATGPLLDQVQQANGSAPANFTIATQAPGAGAATTANGTPGSFNLNFAVPVSTGNDAQFNINRGGTGLVTLAADPGSSGGYSGIWLATAAGSALSGTNYSLLSNGTNLLVNGPTIQFLQSNGVPIGIAQISGAHRGWELGFNSGVTDFAGGDNVFTLAPVVTDYTGQTTTGFGLSVPQHNWLELNGNLVAFSKYSAAPTFEQFGQTTDTATSSMFIQGQNAWASATTNLTGGALLIYAGQGTNTTHGGVLTVGAGDQQTTLVFTPGALSTIVANTSFNNNGNSMVSDAAPRGAGTVNTQSLSPSSQKYRSFCRTTSTTQVSCGTFTMPTSNTTSYLRIRLIGRDVTTHATTSDLVLEETCAAVNVAGTVTAINGSTSSICTATGQAPISGTNATGASNPAGLTFSVSISGTTVTWKVGGVGTDTYDWVLDYDQITN